MKNNRKYLKFKKTVKDEECGICWNEGEQYEVIYEGDDHYILPKQNGTTCGIGKESENEIYVVITKIQ